ncbi:MAG: zf-TFIIB domain-containing protein [Methylococcales bacterium]|nr:zf-TFIIB domain-containing protein [Methylococcales bacterium]
MAKCSSCSAPLPANINRCRYCNVRNDVDLHQKYKYSIKTQHSDRTCPHCNIALQTLMLDLQGKFYIERCKTCFGLFFDPGEIETFLKSSVSNVFDINLKLIKSINKDRYQKKQKVKYLKCPICQQLMSRVNFGHRSGVIIDRCRNHGIWVDSGELTHLMEWKKAGGELLHAKENRKGSPNKKKKPPITTYDLPIYQQQTKGFETDLLETVASLVYRIFT